MGLPSGRLAAGAPADLVLFDPDAPFVLDRFDAAVEIQEHALRRRADAGPRAGHLGRRRAASIRDDTSNLIAGREVSIETALPRLETL